MALGYAFRRLCPAEAGCVGDFGGGVCEEDGGVEEKPTEGGLINGQVGRQLCQREKKRERS